MIKCTNTPNQVNGAFGLPIFPKRVPFLVDGVIYNSMNSFTIPSTSANFNYINFGNLKIHFPVATNTFIQGNFLGSNKALTMQFIGPVINPLSTLEVTKKLWL